MCVSQIPVQGDAEMRNVMRKIAGEIPLNIPFTHFSVESSRLNEINTISSFSAVGQSGIAFGRSAEKSVCAAEFNLKLN